MWRALPAAWKARVHRAVVRADQDAAARRRARAVAACRVQAWAEANGVGVLQVRAGALDIALVDTVLSDLAASLPDVDATTGELTTLQQRRADAFVDLFRCVANHTELPTVGVRRVHDLGLVLHADTLFDTGPQRNALGELRGLGTPTPLDATSARELAVSQLQRGTAVQVLVVDDTGALTHVVRLTDPAVTKSRDALREAVHSSLAHPPPSRPTATAPPPPSPATSWPKPPPAPPTTADGAPEPATSTTTTPGPAAPPPSPTSTPSADATTSPRPTRWCDPTCTPAPAEASATSPGR